MSNPILWVVTGVVVAIAAAAMILLPTAGSADTPPPVTIDSLEAWVEFTQRPGFELLDKQAFEDYYIAIYRTPADELAFCYRWRGEGPKPSTSLAVRDALMQNLQDAARTDERTALNATGTLPAGGFIDHMVIPIKPDHEGEVMLVFRDDVDDPGELPDREVYLRTVPWTR